MLSYKSLHEIILPLPYLLLHYMITFKIEKYSNLVRGKEKFKEKAPEKVLDNHPKVKKEVVDASQKVKVIQEDIANPLLKGNS